MSTRNSSQAGSGGSADGRRQRRPGLPRRRFLAGAAGAGALAAAAGAPSGLAAGRRASLAAGPPGGLPGVRQVRHWEEQLV
ncbi:MAG: hypothetical protein ACLPUO_00155, partial [Streptosporangiaceae bacterium]